MDAIFPYRAMARNNAWANYRVLTACAALKADEWTAIRVSFFPTIRATLNHIVVVDQFYVDGMEGGTLGPKAWEHEQPYESIDTLRRAQKAVDQRLLALVDDLDAQGLERTVVLNRGDWFQHERMARLLLHLFQHQLHHRGQVHAMLRGTSVDPPQLDEFFLSEDKHRRASDFSAIGWAEDSAQ